MAKRLRNLVLVLGDQLDATSAAFEGFEPDRDAVWMAEVAGEATQVWTSKPRIAVFLAAMRHFREELRRLGRTVHYREPEDADNRGTLAAELEQALKVHRPERVILVEPGEWRVAQELGQVVRDAGVTIDIRADRHFLCSRAEFAEHARGRKQLRMEYFYREMRRHHRVLVDASGQPVGGQWNFDHDNRGSFGHGGPGTLPAPVRFAPDELTREVLEMVARRFAKHPGRLDSFDWPVTAAQAREALRDFVAHRLPQFGEYQDAMWTGEPWLYHSRLAAAMNLKLLDPREVIAVAEQAWRSGRAPLASVEGFIRQILGWREYVRGIYWHFMPGYLAGNALGATEALPEFYWTGEVPMACLRDAIHQTLEHGYAHHIQRLMVTGLYALLLGVEPQRVHEWYLAVYVDAVEWVELPNTLGMSQYADGGVMASKPYIATGKYIQRMSNACAGCRFKPANATGPDACPFTTLYWDFLLRHGQRLATNPRMALQVKNAARLGAAERSQIQARARAIRAGGGVPPAKVSHQADLGLS
jgi:deoxyribodipyrimidine photolyase-related protein